MGKFFKPLLGFFVYSTTFLVILLTVMGFWSVQEFVKPGPLKEERLLEVHKGASLGYIAEKLQQEKIISQALLFRAGVKILGEAENLKAGEYKVESGMSMQSIMELLTSGKSYQRFITLPEGLTSYEVVRILNSHQGLKGEPIKEIPAEGSLLPETYSYARGETRQDILRRMKNSMDAIQHPETIELCTIQNLEGDECWHAVITLASIVEKETSMTDERNRVAGVFFNRLRRGIALQTDPTVIYAITMGKHENNGKGPLGRRLLKKDLEFDSPYNTYKYPGLPPGPIANPGKAAIEAVLNPEENEFIYFVADGTGGHMFAKTLNEHNRNVAAWRKIRRSKN